MRLLKVSGTVVSSIGAADKIGCSPEPEETSVAKTPADPKANRRTRQGRPEDRFDRIQRKGRVGAHRVTVRPRYVWQYLIAGLLGFALLTTAGIFAVQSLNVGSSLLGDRGPSTVFTPPTPKLDPEATVAILNGTATPNLARALENIITDKEWGQILFSGSADKNDVEISAVFYRDKADEAAAAGLAAKLGGISTYPTDSYKEYDAKLVVLIGADYAGPGIEESKAMTKDADAPDPEAPGIDPETGFTIDPDTGRLVDPDTGWLIDPDTGLPVDPETEQPTQ